MPHCAHRLGQLRLQRAKPDCCYHRFQLSTLDFLIDAIKYPDRARRLPELPAEEVKRLGVTKLEANDLVRAYENSPLYGKLRSDSSLKQLARAGVTRRKVNRFRQQAVDLGFRHFDMLTAESLGQHLSDELPRWPVI